MHRLDVQPQSWVFSWEVVLLYYVHDTIKLLLREVHILAGFKLRLHGWHAA